ncbi:MULTISPECIES: hypothetical protein [unclassified Acinetobacter]|uniref:hypothetical protein n=1 Tax=unclassified Acinetobacter TaxID=196816 RepID=UPI00293441D9|nr:MULTISPECIES: hypothetical protein [unclassified Acinetobacter]WOE31948.1 hypothetical protein QSG84_01605 [Acinetobacter sp. SAAs470]WOE37416.1 hypothetical protein QSG86_10650 [Acinetobacter sp. SAAs474]
MTKQYNECKVQFNDDICPECNSDLNVLNLDNPVDAFIANGGFDQAMTKAAESLPDSIVESLKEIS